MHIYCLRVQSPAGYRNVIHLEAASRAAAVLTASRLGLTVIGQPRLAGAVAQRIETAGAIAVATYEPIEEVIS